MSFLDKLFGAPVPGMSVAQAETYLKGTPPPFLLDVRNPDEYREGHIPGARLVTLSELSNRLNEIPRDREILCVCRSGNRSASATRQLRAAGYTALNLNGGMIAWSGAKLPIKKGSAR